MVRLSQHRISPAVHRLPVSNFGQYYQYYTNLNNVLDDSDWQQNRTDIEMARRCPTVSHSTEQYHHVKEDTRCQWNLDNDDDSRMVSSQPDTSSWTNFHLGVLLRQNDDHHTALARQLHITSCKTIDTHINWSTWHFVHYHINKWQNVNPKTRVNVVQGTWGHP